MSQISPTHIAVHQKSRVLEIHFSDGSNYELPFEYLRVFSPSAEVRAAKNRGDIIRGKGNVIITGAEPVGSYAVRLIFDDGHDSGVYAWTTLKTLADEKDLNWAEYQQQLHQAEHQSTDKRTIRVLFFVDLARKLDTESLQLDLPGESSDVNQLIEQLKARGDQWQQTLDSTQLTITVNRQFASLDQLLFAGDEVALTPKS